MKLIFVQLHSHCSKYNFKFYKFSHIFLKTFCENLNPKKFLGTTFPGSDTFSTSDDATYKLLYDTTNTVPGGAIYHDYPLAFNM